MNASPSAGLPRIVIVGGGAGGLELATRLGDTLGRRRRADITLIERGRSHLWKPLLHQAAAGTLGIDDNALNYLAQSSWHHFSYRLGAMDGLDRARKEVLVAPTLDEETGREIVPRRRIGYDILVIAVGSQNNDFGTPGAAEYAIALDTPEDARRFHRRLVNACIAANTQTTPLRPEQLKVVAIGAGATGVELVAELHNSTRVLAAYGLDRIDPERDVRLSLVEAAPRILPALPERLSAAAAAELAKLGVQMHTGKRVTEVTATGVRTADGDFLPAELVVWAAGVKAPDFLRDLEGLETNRINQLVVRSTLQTTRDDAIYAIGDCAACPWEGHAGNVPPRAQAAHQQASFLLRQIQRQLQGRPLRDFRYRDFGSLVSLGEHSTVGNLMGGLSKGSLFIEGHFARFIYWLLYRMHLHALHGFWKTVFLTLARLISRPIEPRIKLH
ncbi:NAD(P)/FAD-dependent oxidoreductase [Thiomonas sp.]|jgi:NADH dehydrogenase|uniref:NAD(P)/FAD-dependent oxidoreductase n=1 Tax=Thiomonas sp. TaxID=2047785 RepID=UPI0026347FEC|nr:NAD(P)/FAD-dependent oxidoreductase [Thiomonas sp.]